MADVSFTATAIKAGSGARYEAAQLGEAGITQGMALYQNATDNKWYKADCTSATEDAVAGFALGAGGTDQWIMVLTDGPMTCDGLTAGTVYVLSEAGAIAPAADLGLNDYVTVVGAATATTSLKVSINVTGYKIIA